MEIKRQSKVRVFKRAEPSLPSFWSTHKEACQLYAKAMSSLSFFICQKEKISTHPRRVSMLMKGHYYSFTPFTLFLFWERGHIWQCSATTPMLCLGSNGGWPQQKKCFNYYMLCLSHMFHFYWLSPSYNSTTSKSCVTTKHCFYLYSQNPKPSHPLHLGLLLDSPLTSAPHQSIIHVIWLAFFFTKVL